MQHNKISKFAFFHLLFFINQITVNKFSIEILSFSGQVEFFKKKTTVKKNFRQFFQLHPVKCDKLSHIKQHRTQNSLFLLIIFGPKKKIHSIQVPAQNIQCITYSFLAKLSQKEVKFWFFFSYFSTY